MMASARTREPTPCYLIDEDDYQPALQSTRSIISVIHCLNDRRVHSRMVYAANLVRSELALADQEWMDVSGGLEPTQLISIPERSR